MNNFRKLTIKDVGIVITGKTPSTQNPEYFGGNTPFITPRDMDGRRFIDKSERYLTKYGVDSVKNAFVPKNSVLVSCIGSMGKVSIAGNDCITNQQINSVIVNEVKCNFKYLYYDLSLRKEEIQSKASGSAQPILNKTDFSNLTILLPPLDEQKAIAHILGTLDDKIELNRKMNETLEAMARAIFKSWFVDFDPVRAKMDGRQPYGMDTETAALFPDSFEDSELGKIPKGWKVKFIKDVAKNIQYGLTRSASEIYYEPHFLRITDIKGGRVNWKFVPSCDLLEDELEKYEIKEGDIFIARTGASTGENIYVIDPPKSVFASYLIRIQFYSLSISRIIGAFLRTPIYFDYVSGVLGGSAQPNANAQVLTSIKFTFPSELIAEEFYNIVHPLDKKKRIIEKESSILEDIRDTLLPKLISGEIRVKDAERFIDSASEETLERLRSEKKQPVRLK